ncbi:hypothetical protein ABIC65_003214 [Sphingomonas trueperi]|uniref:hypothetical protein n=1 Tax=Sphingomonas trueperi TaxID=53317 RepID=UPI003396E4BB
MANILRILACAGAVGAGILLLYLGLAQHSPAALPWAGVALFGGITGFIFGTGGEPAGSIDPPKLGGKFTGLPDWLTITDMILVVLALIASFVLKG